MRVRVRVRVNRGSFEVRLTYTYTHACLLRGQPHYLFTLTLSLLTCFLTFSPPCFLTFLLTYSLTSCVRHFQVNPPFVDGIIDAVAEHMLRLLSRAQAANPNPNPNPNPNLNPNPNPNPSPNLHPNPNQAAAAPLCFVVVLPGWRDSAGWQALAFTPLSHLLAPAPAAATLGPRVGAQG